MIEKKKDFDHQGVAPSTIGFIDEYIFSAFFGHVPFFLANVEAGLVDLGGVNPGSIAQVVKVTATNEKEE
jgi:hypothetical protein